MHEGVYCDVKQSQKTSQDQIEMNRIASTHFDTKFCQTCAVSIQQKCKFRTKPICKGHVEAISQESGIEIKRYLKAWC